MSARRRPAAEMTSPFDSPSPIFCTGIFQLSLTVQKLTECIDLAGNFAFGLKNLGFLEDFDPEI
jgi:hypothetical protein